jgi:hypothetical protein
MSGIIRIGILATLMTLGANPVLAYVGPGAGLGLLSAFWALLSAIVSSLAFLVIWPIRHRLRRRRESRGSQRKPARGNGEGDRRS